MNESKRILDQLLSEITDYETLQLTKQQYTKLLCNCAKWKDKESIEVEINVYLQSIGYIYKDYQWVLDK